MPSNPMIYATTHIIQFKIAGQCEYARAPKLSAHKLSVRRDVGLDAGIG